MSSRIYMGRLNVRATERDIERFLKNYGRVRCIMLKNGYGFVDFEDSRDADDAVHELHGREFMGDRLIVEHAKGPSGRSQRSSRAVRPTWLDKYGAPVRTGYKLIVENLSSRVSWQDLKDYMRQAGDVTYADAHKDKRNEGVVEFASKTQMIRALEKLDGTEINGRKIKLVEDSRNKKDSRSRSRSYSRRRSRSRSSRRRRSVSRSRSGVRKHKSDNKRDESKDRSNSRDVEKAKVKSRKRSYSRERKQNRSLSGDRSRDRSRERSQSRQGSTKRSKSRDRSNEKSMSRDRSRETESHSQSRNRSTSKDSMKRDTSEKNKRRKSESKESSGERIRDREKNKKDVHKIESVANEIKPDNKKKSGNLCEKSGDKKVCSISPNENWRDEKQNKTKIRSESPENIEMKTSPGKDDISYKGQRRGHASKSKSSRKGRSGSLSGHSRSDSSD